MAIHATSKERDALSGLVERVTFHSPDTGFCVLRVKVRGHRELVTVLGLAASIRQSLAENAVSRFKALVGVKLATRVFENQQVEAVVKCRVLNRMASLALPISGPVLEGWSVLSERTVKAALSAPRSAITPRSANIVPLITDRRGDVDVLVESVAARMGGQVADARDTCLAGTPAAIAVQIEALRETGVDALFVPTFPCPLPELRRDLERFIPEVAPAFR